jgi:hypothetical protein
MVGNVGPLRGLNLMPFRWPIPGRPIGVFGTGTNGFTNKFSLSGPMSMETAKTIVHGPDLKEIKKSGEEVKCHKSPSTASLESIDENANQNLTKTVIKCVNNHLETGFVTSHVKMRPKKEETPLPRPLSLPSAVGLFKTKSNSLPR